MRLSLFSLVLAAASVVTPARADDGSERSGVVLDVPLLDLPYNARGGLKWPSMGQALSLSGDFYQLLHYGLGQALDPYEGEWWRRVLGRVLIAGADVLVTSVPGGFTWLHEEGHRAVFRQQGISSYNGVYDFRLFASSIAVSRVTDQAMADFKARDPAGFVRLQTAGLELSLELATSLEKTQLFYRTRTYHTALLWETYLLNSSYLFTCASNRSNSLSAEFEQSEGTNVGARDFTGLDCVGSVYDMFRPDEPYDRRGVHPSGVGVRRYRRRGDLSPGEQRFTDQQAYLSLLNFLDPALIELDWFTTKVGAREQPLRWNAHVRSIPAPFGHAVHLEAYGQYGDFNGFVGLLGGVDHDHFFPGLNVELHRFPLDLVVGLPFTVSARTSFWLQPSGLRFQGGDYQPGVLGSLRVAYSLAQAFEPYVEVEGKSAGWVPGNVWLEPRASVRLGLVSTLFN